MALLERLRKNDAKPSAAAPVAPGKANKREASARDTWYADLKSRVHNALFERLDLSKVGKVTKDQVTEDVVQATRLVLDAEMQRIIREEEPLRPSARLSSLHTKAGAVATQRRTDPVALARELFEAAQARRAILGGARSNGAELGRRRRPKHLLSGLLACGHCGAIMVIGDEEQPRAVLGALDVPTHPVQRVGHPREEHLGAGGQDPGVLAPTSLR